MNWRFWRRKPVATITNYCNSPLWIITDAPIYTDFASAKDAKTAARNRGYRPVVVPHVHGVAGASSR